ncbi:MAG TPA: anthranilate synthase component I [Porphyromonadaceae bacterium]|jgi:anthranilate synthase component 1|uniref:anthranilate synthase component I family protein n=1 Tax=Limibacterium fermenti TaxID=3229863 RepID=UPI000E859B24|nr:anthranilate synthase component I [Porphyromonadaceae bacterium]HBL32486.1 anthranilate synthase component I [Porphyromonadaceae bacterium]HBX46017.1 anthranilate synthase component I [Porphyromonadaceae bacterium]HCM19184.1 anthranilate synthase component I [Porphyromonadaceae bacterium]
MKFKLHTHTRRLLGDLHTPVSIYLKVRDAFPESALLESSDFHARDNSTSYVALNPIASVEVNRGAATMRFPDGSLLHEKLRDRYSITDALAGFIGHFDVEGDEKEACGLFGYTTFNCVRYTENIAVKESRPDRNDAPDMLYILYKYLIVFDHFTDRITLIELLREGEESRLHEVESLVNLRNFASFNFFAEGDEYSTITDNQFKEYVRLGRQHCLRGDVFQIVLSRRFVQHFSGDDFKVYRALRSVNPSPYLFYFDFGGYRIFGSSPETHCKIKGKAISIDPIAGTTKRTGNPVEDRKAVDFLLKDPKENAEHVMLVDLARNDISRHAHGVKVEFYKEPQFYSHVIHLVSRVSGTLDEGADPIRAFFDTFPAGTLSGAPKVRAMQLISEIEEHNRGAYGGCIGFIGLNGDLNQAITIRTFVSRNNELWYQAGAGIVSKSEEEYELQEVNSKLGALKKAIDLAASLYHV